jgi:hypothetical protein
MSEENNERVRGLMMAALDGECTAAQRHELDDLLAGDAELRAEWERMGRVKEVTGSMSFREPPPEVWGQYWVSVYNRLERGIGWILVSIGTVVVVGYGAWHATLSFFADSGIPWFIKLAIMAITIGGAFLVVSVLREKLFTYRRDPYKEIER